MINPLIPLQASTPDISSIFSNTLNTLGQINQLKQAPMRNRLLDAQVQTAESQVPTQQDQFNERDKSRIQSIAQGALQLNALPEPARLEAAKARREDLIKQGLPTIDTDQYIGALVSGDSQGAQQMLNNSIAIGQKLGLIKTDTQQQGLASAKTEILPDGSVVQALPSGQVEVRNPAGQIVTGDERIKTLQNSQQFKQEQMRKESGIAVEQARGIAGAKARESRISELRKEYSTSIKSAARSDIKLNQALTLAERATQGLGGDAKLKLAKLFPGIDVTDEGALMSSFRSIALDELQKFKGPTTDFEFGVAQSVGGALGDPKTANIARLNSLKRNNWFVMREEKQFKDFVRSGGDPDSFSFNFGEPVKTKKGVFTLQDLQDTAVQNNLSIDDVLKRLNQ